MEKLKLGEATGTAPVLQLHGARGDEGLGLPKSAPPARGPPGNGSGSLSQRGGKIRSTVTVVLVAGELATVPCPRRSGGTRACGRGGWAGTAAPIGLPGMLGGEEVTFARL